MTWPWDDDEREESVIREVSERNGWFDIRAESGWSFSLQVSHGVVPKPGDAVVTWGSIGRPIRGVAVAGAVAYYRTPDEQAVEDRRQVEAHRAQRIAEYESKRVEFYHRVAEMPEPFQRRIAAFREHGGDDWRWDYEAYEVFCCEQAVAIAALGSRAAIEAFHEAEPEQQRAMVPDLSTDHSGNTFGMACRLAIISLENPELVEKNHGALCPLVGCEDYGCYSVRQKEPA